MEKEAVGFIFVIDGKNGSKIMSKEEAMNTIGNLCFVESISIQKVAINNIETISHKRQKMDKQDEKLEKFENDIIKELITIAKKKSDWVNFFIDQIVIFKYHIKLFLDAINKETTKAIESEIAKRFTQKIHLAGKNCISVTTETESTHTHKVHMRGFGYHYFILNENDIPVYGFVLSPHDLNTGDIVIKKNK